MLGTIRHSPLLFIMMALLVLAAVSIYCYGLYPFVPDNNGEEVVFDVCVIGHDGVAWCWL